MIKFSVIVPVYNIANYVDACVKSILNQTYPDLQIVLVNDGSTDNSLSIINKYREDNRVLIVNKQNGGLSSARNEGLKYATGEYIAYLDGDDWLEKDAFQIVADAILRYGDVDMVLYPYNKAYENGNKDLVDYEFSSKGVVNGQTFFEKSSYKVTAWSKIYRRTYLDKCNLLFLEGRVHEDISYTIPLVWRAEKVLYIEKPLYNYRQDRPGSIMAKVKEKNVDDFTHALCFVKDYAEKNDCLTDYNKNYLVNSFYHTCLTAQTSFHVLSRCMRRNNVSQVINSLCATSPLFFWIKLFLSHINHRSRFLVSQHLLHKA